MRSFAAFACLLVGGALVAGPGLPVARSQVPGPVRSPAGTRPAAPAAAGRSQEETDNPTAYAALRAVQKELGPDSLGRVVEVTGREGIPQPYLWRLTLLEKAGGWREVDVAGGKVVGQRTLARSGRALGNAALNLQSLNLDSSGAFNVADTQARQIHLPFDALNYTLRADPGGKPVWNLELLNPEHENLGTLDVAASDASVLNATGRMASIRPGPAVAAAPGSAAGSPARTEPPAAPNPPEPGAAAAAGSRRVIGATTLRAEHGERNDRTERSERTERNDRSERGESRPEHPPRVTHTERAEQPAAPAVRTVAPPPAAVTVVSPGGAVPPSARNAPVTTTTTVTTLQQTTNDGFFQRSGRTLDKTGRKVERSLRQATGEMERFFTGGRSGAEPPPPPPVLVPAAPAQGD